MDKERVLFSFNSSGFVISSPVLANFSFFSDDFLSSSFDLYFAFGNFYSDFVDY